MSVPQVFKTPNYETLLSDYNNHVLEYVAAKKPELAEEIQEALTNNSELLAQVIQALVLKRVAEKREDGYQAMQMFRRFVSESDMVDLLALQYNLQRQVITPADTSVFPPKPAVLESDEDLLRRFDLAPYQLHTTGTRLGYKYHAITLGERPSISVTTEPNALIMRYEFPTLSNGQMLVKDANANCLEPNSGRVNVAILSRAGDGTCSSELLAKVDAYLNRDDIAQESDEIIVQTAKIRPYRIKATLLTDGDPLHWVAVEQAKALAQDFVNQAHRLGGVIDRLKLGDIFYSLNPKRVLLAEPAVDIECAWDEAPFCTEVLLDVRAE